jgi:hypothetical protein
VLQLDHLNLHVEDVSRSREFYLQVLGPFGYRLLRELRRTLDSYRGHLPSFIASIRSCLSSVESGTQLARSDANLLVSVLTNGLAHLGELQLPAVPLHGDPHAGNLIEASRGFLWLDFESACLGPIEWDLTALPADHAPPQFLTPALHLFLQIRRACVVTWCSQRPSRGPREHEAIAYHLAALRETHAA